MQCESSGCNEESTVDIVSIKDRTISTQTRRCKLHAWDVEPYSCFKEFQTTNISESLPLVRLELAFMVCFDRRLNAPGDALFFVEPYGAHRAVIYVQPETARSIWHALAPMNDTWPFAFHAFVKIMASLDGATEKVVVHGIDTERRYYYTSLEVRGPTSNALIDMQIGDAIGLAIAGKAPIYFRAEFFKDVHRLLSG